MCQWNVSVAEGIRPAPTVNKESHTPLPIATVITHVLTEVWLPAPRACLRDIRLSDLLPFQNDLEGNEILKINQ